MENDDYNEIKNDIEMAAQVAELEVTIVKDIVKKLISTSIDIMGDGKPMTNDRIEIDRVIHFYYVLVNEICTRLLESCTKIEENVINKLLGPEVMSQFNKDAHEYYKEKERKENKK